MLIVTSMPVLLILIFLGVPIALLIMMQVVLSKNQAKWQGLILPMIGFIVACLGSITVRSFIRLGEEQNLTMGIETGRYLKMFAFLNIPTLLFLVIYWMCRRKYRRKADIEKKGEE